MGAHNLPQHLPGIVFATWKMMKTHFAIGGTREKRATMATLPSKTEAEQPA